MIADLAAQKAMDRLNKLGPEALSETERTAAAVWQFCSGVANHGFAAYYSGSRGDLGFAAPAALKAIGAHNLAQIAQEANAVFGPAGPPRDHKTRGACVQALPDAAHETFADLERRYYSCDDEVDQGLERYLAERAKR